MKRLMLVLVGACVAEAGALAYQAAALRAADARAQRAVAALAGCHRRAAEDLNLALEAAGALQTAIQQSERRDRDVALEQHNYARPCLAPHDLRPVPMRTDYGWPTPPQLPNVEVGPSVEAISEMRAWAEADREWWYQQELARKYNSVR